jgi:hypothetical protein
MAVGYHRSSQHRARWRAANPEAPAMMVDWDDRTFLARDIEGAWTASGTLAVLPGLEFAVDSITIEPREGDRVTSSMLRLRLDLIVGAARADLLDRAQWRLLLAELGGSAPAAPAARDGAAPRRGRPGRPESFYRDVARIYLDLVDRGERPLLPRLAEAVAEPGSPPAQRETVKRWVRRCRELGLLSGAAPGRPGAVPGPRLLDS